MKKKNFLTASLVTFALVALTSCSKSLPPSPLVHSEQYLCDNGQRVKFVSVITPEKQSSAAITFLPQEQEVVLYEQVSASGALYVSKDGNLRVFNKGEQILLEGNAPTFTATCNFEKIVN
ncbi:MliC family protein [Psittacicella gerlachiana]|uniref:C-type lysozyme inhibitor domain-containing protein n=1 Tax=Psittacicella gerlachiana TaxID=2028574 RepID=A0A3A1YEY4_9GAMM|nr:MliC family protein [Psittacicella gerlachiana]RIY35728.1 hypothetical protein CKF59_03300 [Psittacicella gerlachiana]